MSLQGPPPQTKPEILNQNFLPKLTPNEVESRIPNTREEKLRNDFFVVTHQRQGDAAWGLTPSSFPVSNMQVRVI